MDTSGSVLVAASSVSELCLGHVDDLVESGALPSSGWAGAAPAMSPRDGLRQSGGHHPGGATVTSLSGHTGNNQVPTGGGGVVQPLGGLPRGTM